MENTQSMLRTSLRGWALAFLREQCTAVYGEKRGSAPILLQPM